MSGVGSKSRCRSVVFCWKDPLSLESDRWLGGEWEGGGEILQALCAVGNEDLGVGWSQ